MDQLKKVICSEFDTIQTWLENNKKNAHPIIYSSIDIRESRFKAASIDTNLFPAGFNNLNPESKKQMVVAFKAFFESQLPGKNNILLFCEDRETYTT